MSFINKLCSVKCLGDVGLKGSGSGALQVFYGFEVQDYGESSFGAVGLKGS